MSKSVPLKLYFGSELAQHLAALIRPHYPTFPTERFVQAVSAQVDALELKGRVGVLATELNAALPADYPEALNILLNILGPENESEQGMFTKGYFLMPVALFVERYGLNHFDLSMQALVEITKRHTAEYAIRPYLNQDVDACLVYLRKWSGAENAHVRRLVSEGTRPRLPWETDLRSERESAAQLRFAAVAAERSFSLCTKIGGQSYSRFGEGVQARNIVLVTRASTNRRRTDALDCPS